MERLITRLLFVFSIYKLIYIYFFLFSFFFQNDSLSPSSFSFEDFLTFYKNLSGRTEVEKIFDEL